MKARKLKSGNWNIRVKTGTNNGKTIYSSVTAPTKSECEMLAAKMMGISITDITVKEACDRFLELRGPELSPSTIRGYKGTLSRYIEKDKISGVKLSKLTSPMLQEWVGRIKCSKKTKSNHLGFLLSVIRFHDVDKVFRVRIAPTGKKEMYTPTEAEVNKVLDLADDETHLAMSLACLGLRRGEVCALTADDVDRKNQTIRVNKALAKDSDGNWIVKTPKTKKSIRTVEAPLSLINILPTEGKLISVSPDVITLRFIEAVKNAGVPHFRFHDLRSFSASLQLSPVIGASRMSVKDIHGWETDRMLEEHYDRSMADQKKKDSAKICLYLENHIHFKRA